MTTRHDLKADQRMLVFEWADGSRARVLILERDVDEDRMSVVDIVECQVPYYAVEMALDRARFDPGVTDVLIEYRGRTFLPKRFKTRKAQVNAYLNLAGLETEARSVMKKGEADFKVGDRVKSRITGSFGTVILVPEPLVVHIRWDGAPKTRVSKTGIRLIDKVLP